MAKSPLLLGIMTVICYCIISSSAQAEDPFPTDCEGWFGEKCRYKCHCNSTNSCGKDGSCSNCENGRFGPACQYVDLGDVAVITPALTKTEDGKCTSTKEWIHIQWDNFTSISWFRLKFQEEIRDKNDIKIRLKETNNPDGTGKAIMECVKQTSALVDSKTVDIYCDMDMAISQVNISGPQLKALCTVNISGGRNIALKADTEQSSNYHKNVAQLAVDGDTNSDFDAGSCSHTGYDSNPHWKVTFPSENSIYKYTIYNRAHWDERLKGFTLEALDSDNNVVYKYTDTHDKPKSVYTIIPTSIKPKIKHVRILPSQNGEKIVTLCEVEIQGDQVCPTGFYGLQCKDKCKCHVEGEPCFSSSGVCPSGCATGLHQEGCQKTCTQGRWGIDCLERCEVGCNSDNCHVADGHCVYGCKQGYRGSHCTIGCDNGYYGLNCVYHCPKNCNDKFCDTRIGNCYGCKNGYTGERCEKECSAGLYGNNCSQTCSPNCGGKKLCHPINGTCLDGCQDGYTGAKCSEQCGPGKYGTECLHNCSNQCLNTLCNHENGICTNCPLGKMGDQCDKECVPGRHGHNCNETCSLYCYNSSECNPVDGVCPNGCQDGYRGDKCIEMCDPWRYGKECEYNCSHLCLNQTCNHRNGTCNSCPPGKIGDLCDMDCEPKRYGKGCLLTCSSQCLDLLCNHENGTCTNCPKGKMGEQCDHVCERGWHGYNCNETCSLHCLDPNDCDPVSGICNGSCQDGYTGATCSEICESGMYGKECNVSCSLLCLNQTCDHKNGTCTRCPTGNIGDQCDKVCAPGKYGMDCLLDCSEDCLNNHCYPENGTCMECRLGKMGDQCDKECDPGRHGFNCNKKCSLHCLKQNSCHPVNGYCLGGCRDGYTGQTCSESCLPGMYGKDCNEMCSKRCLNEMCNNENGTCIRCPPGRIGDKCDNDVKTTTQVSA